MTTTAFTQIAWGRPRLRDGRRPTDAELEKALATANASGRLTLADLYKGQPPKTAFRFVAKVVRAAAKHGSLIVTHTLSPGLRNLLATAEVVVKAELRRSPP